MDLVEKIYQVCKYLPRDEMHGLSSQLKRAAVSIPSNIAEGSRRRHPAEQTQFYSIAFGSGAEIETQIELCHRLKFITEENRTEIEKLLSEVMMMLNKLVSMRR